MRRIKPDRFKHFLQLIPVSLLFLLCGCVSHSHWTWQHPNDPGELQQLKDRKECRDLALTEVAQINYYYAFYGYGIYNFPFYSPHQRDRFYRPYLMEYHHYRFFQQQDDFERFFRICMKAKGWQRVKIEPELK